MWQRINKIGWTIGSWPNFVTTIWSIWQRGPPPFKWWWVNHQLCLQLGPHMGNPQAMQVKKCEWSHNLMKRGGVCGRWLRPIFKRRINYRNPSLRLTTKARACKGASQDGNLGITSHAPGNAREWGNEPHIPKWELESRWTLESSQGNCKVKTHWIKEVLYIIGDILERRCLKWARMTHLETWNINYDTLRVEGRARAPRWD